MFLLRFAHFFTTYNWKLIEFSCNFLVDPSCLHTSTHPPLTPLLDLAT